MSLLPSPTLLNQPFHYHRYLSGHRTKTSTVPNVSPSEIHYLFFFFFNFSQLKALSSSQKKREKGIHVRNTLSISLSSTQRTICPLVFSPLLTPQRMTETRAKNQERLRLARSSRLCLLQLAFPWQGSEMLTWGPEELYLTAQGPTPENYKKRDRRAVWIQLIQCKMCKGQN